MSVGYAPNPVLKPLPLGLKPIIGESTTSFVSRIAEKNGIPLFTLLKVVSGVPRRTLENWSAMEWDRLALLSGQPLHVLDIFRHVNANLHTCSNAVMVRGHPVKMNYLIRNNIRLCPKCVGESRLLREAWAIVLAPTCIRHGNLLIDQCECGRKFGMRIRGADPFSCRCGKPFQENSTTVASAGALESTRLITSKLGWWSVEDKADLAKRPKLPEPFGAMPVGDLLALLNLIGRVASTPAGRDQPLNPRHSDIPSGEIRGLEVLEENVRIVESAMKIVTGWPEAYQRLLKDVSARNSASSPKNHRDLFRTRMGRLLAFPPNGLDRHPIACLMEQLNHFCRSRGLPRRRIVPIRHSSTARKLAKIANVSQIATEMGVCAERKHFISLYNDVAASLDNVDAEPSQLALLLRSGMSRRWEEMHNRMSPWQASAYLDNPRSVRPIQAWIDAGLLRPSEEVVSKHPYRSSLRFFAKDVHDLRRRLGETCPLVDELPEGYRSYETVSKRMNHFRYRKSDLIRDVFSKRISAVKLNKYPRMNDLYLDSHAVYSISLAHRLSYFFEIDAFMVNNRLERVLDELWPNRSQRLTFAVRRQLRQLGVVRFKRMTNDRDGRERPIYHFSLIDLVRREFSVNGPSVSSQADELIISHR